MDETTWLVVTWTDWVEVGEYYTLPDRNELWMRTGLELVLLVARQAA
jgi:hypothetical protein